MVPESWFSSLWKNSRRSTPETEKATIGILAFELVGLMSKLASLWNSLSDKEVARLKSDLQNLLGVRKLVSEDDDYLMDLALSEIIENLGYVAKSVVRLGKRCTNPGFHHLELVFINPIENGDEWFMCEYKWKKMEKKVRKMESFITATLQLHQELDVLSELEQTLRRMQSYADGDKVKLLEFQQKVMYQRQEVRYLRDMSPWNKSYDYTVRILSRSLFTILERIKSVFGINQKEIMDGKIVSEDIDCLPRSFSFSAPIQSSVHPSENNLCGLYSGPLVKSTSKPIVKENKSTNKLWQSYNLAGIFRGKSTNSKTKRLAHFGPFKGCMESGNNSPVLQSRKQPIGGSMRTTSYRSRDVVDNDNDRKIVSKVTLLNSKGKLSNPQNAPPDTLGEAALALHYANIIILIEKLAASPHLISHDARDDLYNMLPTTLKNILRGRLKLYAKTLASSVYNPTLAAEWSLALSRILEWLSPLAHNMIRWQSERNFEKQNLTSGANVLLVYTLYYANQGKAEAAIAELLMGLNYICRFGREQNENGCLVSTGNKAYGDYLPHQCVTAT